MAPEGLTGDRGVGAMVVLLILIVVALGLAPRVIRKNVRLLNGVCILLCLLALALSAVHYTQRQKDQIGWRGEELTIDRHWIVGWRLGCRICSDFPAGGRVVVLQSPNEGQSWSLMIDSQLAGLRHAMADHSFSVERFRPGMRPPGAPRMEGAPEPVEMDECMNQAVGADAIISFVTMPLGDDPTLLPPVYLLDSLGSGYWRTSMEAGLVRAAVTPRMRVGGKQPGGKTFTLEDRFNSVYHVITPVNIGDFKTPMEQFRESQRDVPSP